MATVHNKPLQKRVDFFMPYKAALIGLVGLFLALSSWAVASPVGSSPDDDYHLASIWCGNGERPGLCETGASPELKKVPIAIAQSICFAYNPDINAGCQEGNLAINSSLLYETDRLNTSGLYPPVFYSVMGLFASDHLQASVVVMRMVNILIFLGLLSVTWLLLGKGQQRALISTYAITLIPLGFFLIPSTNPSSWLISGIGILFFSIVGLKSVHSRKKKIALVIVATAAFVLMSGSRGDGALFSVLAISAAAFVGPRIKQKGRWLYAFATILILLGTLIFITTGQATVVNQGLRGTTDIGSQLTGLNLIFSNILNLPSLIVGIYGSWGLGWLDTVMPPTVWVLALLVSGAIIFTGFSNTNWKKNITSLFVLILIFLIPLYVLYKSQAAVGAYVQPRYILPLVILLVSLAQLPVVERSLRTFNTAQKAITVACLFVAFAVSLHLNMNRYITGMSNPTWNLNSEQGWWWNVPIQPFSFWFAGSTGIALFLWFTFISVEKSKKSLSRHTDK